MKTFRVVPSLVLSVLLSPLTTGCSPAAASPEPAVVPAEGNVEIEPVITTLFGERVLLFMENPPLVRGESARFLAHFSVLETGEPVRAGVVELQIGATRLVANGPKRDGLFLPEGSFDQTGELPATITLTSDQATETLDLGLVTVHASAQQAATSAAAAASDDLPGQVPFLMEQQWKIGALLARAQARQLTQRLVVPAQIVLAEGASAVLSSPVSGRLLAPPGASLVRTGDVVERGQVLAVVEPPLSADVAAQLSAVALQLELQSLEVERQLAEASTRLRFAQAELERIVPLVTKGLATRQTQAQAERDVALAESAQDQATLARTALAESRARRQASSGGIAPGALRLSLPAPIDGVVVDGSWVVGESVDASAELLRIVDPGQLWVVGRVSEFDLALLSASPAAQVTLPALPDQRIAVGPSVVGASGAAGSRADDPGAPVFGAEVELPSRTITIRYALPPTAPAVRPGMLADLEIGVDVVDAPVVIPLEAVVMDQGLPTAYVMVHGELFQRRDLTLGLEDGDFVEVLAGIAMGERVATRGAATIRLAALSPASFGHGHAH